MTSPNISTSGNICLTPDQLASLVAIARVLPHSRYVVFLALLYYLRADSMISTATREQIKIMSGLGYRTIYTCIQEFEQCGLVKAWRGPFEVKQKFCRINLPAPDEVVTFFGGAKQGGTSFRVDGEEIDPDQTGSAVGETISELQDAEGKIVQPEFSIVDGCNGGVVQDFSDIASTDPLQSTLADAPPTISEASTHSADPPDLLPMQSPSQIGTADLPGSDSAGLADAAIDLQDHDHGTSGPFFDDPRIDILVDQIEQGRKQGTRLFKWLKAENILTWWPPTDSCRVEKQLLKQKVQTLDQLTAILSAPVRPEYRWFVTEFLQCCHENGYEVEDTSQVYALEINALLDGILRPAYQGRPLWTKESVKTQLRTMIEDWTGLRGWPQLPISVERPTVPTLKFFVTNQVVWESARQRLAEQSEVKILKIFEMLEHDGHEMPTNFGR